MPLDLSGISACRDNRPPWHETTAPQPPGVVCAREHVHPYVRVRADTPEPLQATDEDSGHALRLWVMQPARQDTANILKLDLEV